MLQPDTLSFLKSLSKNNSKEWFDANRKKYEAAKKDFSDLTAAIIAKFGTIDTSIAHLQPKDCMFRINRDVRFSKNKSPYKTNFGASINPGGKKSLLAGYYLHCEPGASFTGGGIWMPDSSVLKKIRQEIDYNLPAFEKIIQNKTFTKEYGSLYQGADALLSSMPRGYDKDNPAADYLKLKSVLAMKPLTDEELVSKQLTQKITAAFKALQPMIVFINHALSE